MKRQKLFGLREKTKPALTSKRDSSVAFTISHISPLLSISAVTTPAVSQIRILLTLLPPRSTSHNIGVLTCCTFWNPFVFSAEACLHYRQPAQGLTHQLFSRKYFPLWSSATNLNSVSEESPMNFILNPIRDIFVFSSNVSVSLLSTAIIHCTFSARFVCVFQTDSGTGSTGSSGSRPGDSPAGVETRLFCCRVALEPSQAAAQNRTA